MWFDNRAMAVGLLVVAGMASAAEPVELRWKLTKGDVFYVMHEMDSRIWRTPQDKKQPGDNVVTLGVNVWKVTVAADGKDGLEAEVEYVSSKTGHAKTVEEVKVQPTKGAFGCKLTVTFDGERNVKKVKGAAAWDKAVLPDKMSQHVVMTADEIGQLLAGLFRLVPAGAAKPGEWERTAEYRHKDTLVVYRSTSRAKLDSVTDGVAKVTTETDHRHETDPVVKDPPAVYLSEGKKCGGTFWFDTRTGRLQKFEDTITMTGSHTVNGDKLGHEVVTKLVTTVSDKSFEEK
jgi:hypothetical protein